jgi:hypothetical protein
MNTLQASYRVTFRYGTTRRSNISMQSGRHFCLYPFGIRGDVSERLSATMIDLLRLSMAVNVVDRFLRRSHSLEGFRKPLLELEVLDPGFWNGNEVAKTLKTTLDFLSGDDDWQVRFIPDRSTQHHPKGRLTFREPTTVCLYSGGLDSAAGLAARLRDGHEQTYIPVIGRHQFFRGKLIKNQFDILKRHYQIDSSRFMPLIIAAFVRNRRIQHDFGVRPREITHRCRSFLYTALAGIVAAVEGDGRVGVYESGIGAVNLPLTSWMTGWRTSRSTHPHFLRLMEKLVSAVAQQPIKFELPFIDQTKASMVAVLAQDGLRELAVTTVSCILHPLRRGNSKQCGVCPACIFRRHALQVAGISEPPQAYQHDLFGSVADFNAIPKKQLRALQAFLWQVARLAELERPGTIPRFFRLHLRGTKIVREDTEMAPFVELFCRYRHEWLELAARGQSLGWIWTDWLARREIAA